MNKMVHNTIKVGMAELYTAIPPTQLRAAGLGSCVGVALHDPVQRIAGLAHVMLPSSSLSKSGAVNESKYMDTAIPLLVRKMEEKGGHPFHFKAKIAGGAQMFSFHTSSEAMRVGPRNVEACKKILKSLGIPLIAEDTGGDSGRTIKLDARTGILEIRTVNQGIKEI